MPPSCLANRAGAELEKSVAAFGEVKSSDRVEGADLLQKDIAKRRREEREAMEAFHKDMETYDEKAEDAESGSEEEDDEDDDVDDDVDDVDEDDDDVDDDVDDALDVSDDDDDALDVSDDDDVLDSDSDSQRVRDPITGLKRKRYKPALTMDEKRALASKAVADAERRGDAIAPKVRKNGVFSLSELRKLHKEAARKKREADADGAGADSDADSELGDVRIEHDRILTPEDFKRIKALKTAGQLSSVLDKNGARKASETVAEEMRRMLRAADKSGQADRRVNPDALAAVGLKRAHDKESRVASIMAGREDRGVFGASKDRKNKKEGGTSNKEKSKKKNLPLAARVKAAKNRRTSFVSKRVKDKQFKGRFRK